MALAIPPPNQKTKNSSSEKRGSIVKSIDNLALSIAADESATIGSTSNAAAASMMQAFSAQMQMQMQMQMQQLQLQLQNVYMNNQMANSNRMMKAVMKQLKKQKKKKTRRRGVGWHSLWKVHPPLQETQKIAVAVVVAAVAAVQDTAPMDKYIGFKKVM